MEMNKENILKVQRKRGRGNLNLHATARKGNHEWVFPAKHHEWVFPAKLGQKEYEIVLEWVAEGNQILPPPPKYVDPNRGPWAYRENPLFRLPVDENISVWRYMDLLKFISLLDQRALFFSRGTTLAKGDWREGTLPKSNKDGVFGKLKKMYLDSPTSSKDPRMEENFSLAQKTFKGIWDNAVLINCWSVNSHESKQMWDSFGSGRSAIGSGPSAIAIKSNIASLKKCFGQYVDYDIYIGEVSYIDHEIDEIAETNPIFTPFLYKYKAYEAEREVRCILHDDGDISLFPPDEPSPLQAVSDNLSLCPGIHVPIDLDLLIGEIYLSPQEPSYAHKTVKSLLKKYGLPNKPVLSSGLRKLTIP